MQAIHEYLERVQDWLLGPFYIVMVFPGVAWLFFRRPGVSLWEPFTMPRSIQIKAPGVLLLWITFLYLIAVFCTIFGLFVVGVVQTVFR